MSVDNHVVKKIARLARISVSEEKSETFSADLGNILNWIEQLKEVNTDGVEPLSGVNEHALVWREDNITDGEITDKVLKNAPETAGVFFVVPKVIE